MSLKKPEFIYFDLGNVLLFFDHRRAAQQMAAVAGVPQQLAWQVVFASDLHNNYECGRLTSQQFCDHFCAATESCAEHDSLLHAASDIFETNHAIVPILYALHREQYRLGILSNTNEAHWNFVNRGEFAQVLQLFSVRALSFEIKSMKPAPQIYQLAAEMAEVAPEKIFFTDDRPENVVAACEAGFDAVLFQDVSQLARELRNRGVLRS